MSIKITSRQRAVTCYTASAPGAAIAKISDRRVSRRAGSEAAGDSSSTMRTRTRGAMEVSPQRRNAFLPFWIYTS
jgi:hypothetical protein